MRGGGSEQQTLLLLRHLDRERFDPVLYVSEKAGSLLDDVPSDVQVVSFDDAPQDDGFYFPGRELRRQAGFVRSVLQQQSIDVVYDRTFHMSLIAAPACESLGIARVSTIVSPPHFALPLVEKRFVYLKRRRLAKAYRQSYRVIAVSDQAAESAREYYNIDKNLCVVHNPVDIERVKQMAQQPLSGEISDFERNENEPLLVCVGRMTSEKGHADLIDALKINEDQTNQRVRVLLVGDGPLRADLEKRCQGFKKTRVEFLGRLSNPAPLVAAADALVLPSHFEGMPNVVLEAMCLGTPVVSTKAGGTIELQREAKTIWWADVASPSSLAIAIDQCLKNPAEAKNRSEAASQLVSAHHDARKVTRRIEDILADAAASGLSI